MCIMQNKTSYTINFKFKYLSQFLKEENPLNFCFKSIDLLEKFEGSMILLFVFFKLFGLDKVNF